MLNVGYTVRNYFKIIINYLTLYRLLFYNYLLVKIKKTTQIFKQIYFDKVTVMYDNDICRGLYSVL